MQNEVPTEFAPGEAEEVVCKNLGIRSLNEVFSEFQPNPVGSASIGQVHIAKLKTTGEVVAVKIMGRGVEERFRADIATLIDFLQLAMPQHVEAMKEIQRQFVTEFDYRGEAQNLLDVRNNILPRFSEKVYIPKPFLEYCTKEVLVMEYVPGPTLVKGIRQSFGEYAIRHGTTLESLEEEQKALMRRPDFKFRDIQDEARRIRLYSAAIRAKDALYNAFVSTYNWTVVSVLRLRPKEHSYTPQLLNLGAIIHTLTEIHAWEILKDGAFSCDPHPGNVLLMPDGRLGLIDLGQFKRIPLEARLALAKTLVAIANDDQATAVRTLRDYGVRSRYNKSDVCYKLAVFWYDRNSKDITGGRNLQEFMEAMEAEDPSGGLPEDLIMPGRVSVMMRACTFLLLLCSFF
jgi:aarF domain-containing kinase